MYLQEAVRSPVFDYEFSDEERNKLMARLLNISSNPYTQHAEFMQEIEEIAQSDSLSAAFCVFSRMVKERDKGGHPFTFVRNAPIDLEMPDFDWSDPVRSKRRLKRTFVCEGFLALFARLQDRPVIGHLSVNDGDFYHDILPKQDMAETQSQKGEKTLYFHKDFTNHFARPDCVYTLTLRNSDKNEVVSTYVSNAEIIGALDRDTLEVLRQPVFGTPYDDVSQVQRYIDLGEAPDHAILENEMELRVFENRTIGRTPAAERALRKLLSAMHALKIGIHQRPGDFVAIENDFCLHGKEVRQVNAPDELRRRWLIKSHNVTSLDRLGRYFLQDRPSVING